MWCVLMCGGATDTLTHTHTMAHTGPAQENNILYELLVHAEWPLEPEVHVSIREQGREGLDKGNIGTVYSPFPASPSQLIQCFFCSLLLLFKHGDDNDDDNKVILKNNNSKSIVNIMYFREA